MGVAHEIAYVRASGTHTRQRRPAGPDCAKRSAPGRDGWELTSRPLLQKRNMQLTNEAQRCRCAPRPWWRQPCTRPPGRLLNQRLGLAIGGNPAGKCATLSSDFRHLPHHSSARKLGALSQPLHSPRAGKEATCPPIWHALRPTWSHCSRWDRRVTSHVIRARARLCTRNRAGA